MQIQVNTGNGMANKEALERWASSYLNDSLGRYRDELTRIEVQLTDESRGKKGDDRRCMLEARVNGHAPVVVNHNGESMDDAFRGATIKLIRALERTLGKLDRHEHRARDTIRKDLEAPEAPVDSA
jgi:ribosome-associated translation inhibitor RaiA